MSETKKVALQGLFKRYSEGDSTREVLSDLDLTLYEEEMAVLLGKSGSGKSTLLNIISGIDVPDEGTVSLGDSQLSAMSEHQRTLFRRSRIGFVFQSYNLIPTLTVEENVLLPLELSGRNDKQQQEKAMSFLEEVGLHGRRGSFPDRLSGGEQQRVAIARALAHDPLLVLADEPTGNLDSETGQQVLDVFQRLVRKSRRTVLIATHDLDLRQMADRTFHLQKGQVKLQSSEAKVYPGS